MIYKGNKIRFDFNMAITYTGRKCVIFKILKKRKSEPNVLHLAKWTFKYKGHRHLLSKCKNYISLMKPPLRNPVGKQPQTTKIYRKAST